MPITLTINAKPVECYTVGNTSSDHIFLTIGPGSLYFPIYPEAMKENAFLIAYDAQWLHERGSAVDADAISAITLASLVSDIRQVVLALKIQYPDKKLHLLANSVVTSLALQCAYDITELDSTLCIGTPLKPITANFDHVKDLPLSDEDRQQLDRDLERYQRLVAGEENSLITERHPDSNIENGRLTPVSSFVEQCRSLNVLALKNYLHHSDTILTMWRHGPKSKSTVLNLAMRDHFFNNIQPEISIISLLERLNKRADGQTVLFWGETDGITPYDLTLLSQYPSVQHRIFSDAGHFPQFEAGDDFVKSLVGCGMLASENNKSSITAKI